MQKFCTATGNLKYLYTTDLPPLTLTLNNEIFVNPPAKSFLPCCAIVTSVVKVHFFPSLLIAMSNKHVRLIADPATGCFPKALCSECEELPTQHRCLAPVKSGGVLFGPVGQQRVCGVPVCAPCNTTSGNENVYRCADHLDKENDAGASNVKQKAGKNNNNKPLTGAVARTAEYSATELLILSQAYIKTSENAIEGTYRRQSKFWDDVSECYKKVKAQQEAYDERCRKHKRYTDHNLRRSTSSEFYESSEDEGEKQTIPPRTASSLQQKWSKFVQPLVTKFIGLTQRHPKRSGEGNTSFLMFALFFSFFIN